MSGPPPGRMHPPRTLVWPLLVLLCLFLVDTGALEDGAGLLAAPQPSPLPVDASDPSWGSPSAPVTLIGFSDLECPYCDRVLPTLAALQKHYGAKKLRVVHKHFPLAFHKQAETAAQVGAAVQTLEGSRAFFDYQRAVFSALRNGDAPRDVVKALGFDAKAVGKLLATGKPKKKVATDVALGKRVGVKATPTFFVNGIFLSGAKQRDKFVDLIDAQLVEANALRKKGVAPAAISARLTRKNLAAKAGQPGATVWKVPVDGSPALGAKHALVTLVMFSDFECPYCVKMMPTLAALRKKYGADLRVVFKHNPLSFHKRADGASQLAIEAHRQKGEGAFWRAADQLFAPPRSLAPADLERIAGALKLDVTAAMAAITERRHKERIEADQLLARDVRASGTPASYINGRKVNGAGGTDRFETIIDEELIKAKSLTKAGIPRARVYEHIMKTAKGPKPPPRKVPPKIDAQTPVTSARAKLTVQVFVDFESGFWLRALPAIRRVQQHFKGKVRLAFRHKPLAFHKNARRAHEAAQEAFAQKGNKGFWAIYDRIASDPHKLDEATLLAHAKHIGMDTAELVKAWRQGRHTARIDADVARADKLAIASVPALLVGEYYVNGAKSFVELKRVVELALP